MLDPELGLAICRLEMDVESFLLARKKKKRDSSRR
jgi:hypothetical protein